MSINDTNGNDYGILSNNELVFLTIVVITIIIMLIISIKRKRK